MNRFSMNFITSIRKPKINLLRTNQYLEKLRLIDCKEVRFSKVFARCWIAVLPIKRQLWINSVSKLDFYLVKKRFMLCRQTSFCKLWLRFRTAKSSISSHWEKLRLSFSSFSSFSILWPNSFTASSDSFLQLTIRLFF